MTAASRAPQKRGGQEPRSASENTTAVPLRRSGHSPLELPDGFGAVLEDYIRALAAAPFAAPPRRTCTSKVRQYAWHAARRTPDTGHGGQSNRLHALNTAVFCSITTRTPI